MAKEAHKGKTLPEIAKLYGVGQYALHFLLCTGPDCCTEEAGQAAWNALKSKSRELDPRLSEAKLYRTRVDCLRMCQDGPIAVCYPQGLWFRGVTAERVNDVIDHLVSGSAAPHPLAFAANPLGEPNGGRKPGP
jgi:(2Fe-2S) ferredoxin